MDENYSTHLCLCYAMLGKFDDGEVSFSYRLFDVIKSDTHGLCLSVGSLERG